MFSNISGQVEIVEVGPRDGLQNEKTILALEDKLKLIKVLAEAGLKNIEATSFVHPKWVPQLADGDLVMKRLDSLGLEKVNISALIPNERGFQRALDVGVKEICLFVSASASHNKNNVNMTPEESVSNFESIIKIARDKSIRVRTIIVTAFACPFEGMVAPDKVLKLAKTLEGIGSDEIILADTIGRANPAQVYSLFKLLKQHIASAKLSAHFHDTMGMGLANVIAALQAGITKFDSSIGGLGGCPYAPGASGNIATEDLVNMLESMGIKTGINIGKLIEITTMIESMIGRPVTSHMKNVQLNGECKNM